MTALSSTVVKEFYQLCNWAYEAWSTHRVLFDENPKASALQASAAGDALGRLSIITQEYVLHQISKLHDPAVQQGQTNLGIDYILKFGGWEPATHTKLCALQTRLDELAQKLRPARNKVLSHNDLVTILSSATLAAFPAGEDKNYFEALQEFANLVHDQVVGGPCPFNDLSNSDAVALVASLKP